MSFTEGKSAIQFRCAKCGTVSPREGKCFYCGGQKIRAIVPQIATKRTKGQSINVRIG